MSTRRVFASVVCLLFSVFSLPGQTSAGLTGTLTDATGAVVPGARVALIHTETGVRRNTVSNEAGLYQFPLLPPGDYSIAVEKEGFKQLTREGIRLEVNQTARKIGRASCRERV